MACTVRGEKYQFELKASGNPAYAAVALSDDSKMVCLIKSTKLIP